MSDQRNGTRRRFTCRQKVAILREHQPTAGRLGIITPRAEYEISRALEHFPRMGKGLVGDIDPAQHAGDLLDAAFAAQAAQVGVRLPSPAAFLDLHMLMGQGRHLGQMGDAQHLTVVGEPAQLAADDLGHTATDSGIDLVENQRRHAAAGGGDDLNGEADAR